MNGEKFMVLDIRGTHGSGKSFIMHRLLDKFDYELINDRCEYRKRVLLLGYHLKDIDAVVLGRYASNCGGCDGIGSADEVCRRVRMFHKDHKLVLLEGILVAHTFQRYSDLADELGDYCFLFLNTPLATCITRVERRRREAGNTKKFDPKNVIHDHRQIWVRTRKKMKEAGHTVIELEWTDPLPQVLEEIGNA